MATIGYVRVSTVQQNTDRQQLGKVDRIFEDKVSGKDLNRPQLMAMLDYVREGDEIVCYSIDRLARSVLNLLELVEMLQKKGVSLRFIKDGLHFVAGADATATQKLQLTMLAAFGQFERDIIRERQAEGIAIAKAKGVYKGGKPRIDRESVKTLLARGWNKAKIAEELGMSRTTVYRIIDELNQKTST